MAKPRNAPPDFRFDYRFVVALCRLFTVFYPGFEWAALFTVLTLITAAAKEVVNYYSGLSIGDYYGALIGNDESAFWKVFGKSSGLYLGQCMLLALMSFFSWCLYLSFRRNVTTYLHKLYFADRFAYELNVVDDRGIDNPDQRIAADVEKMCNLLATGILPVAMLAPLIIAYYTWQTWSKAGLLGVGLIYGYFLIGTIVNRLLISPLSKWSARVERTEGNFRYKHVSIRNHAEEISFYHAETYEMRQTQDSFDELLGTQKSWVIWRLPAQFFQYLFDYYGGVLNYAIQVIPVFWLKSYAGLSPEDLGTTISNNAFVFIYLVNSFTTLTDVAINVGQFSGYVQRIEELVRAGRKQHEQGEFAKSSFSLPTKEREAPVIADNLIIGTPDGHTTLLAGISFSLLPGQSLLIKGPSGVGKSSLLRVLAQLWQPKQGKLHIALPQSSVMFLPQRPYFPVGRLSLKEQIFFPRLDLTEAELVGATMRIVKILEMLGLTRLLNVAQEINDPVDFEWQDQLSPGEQQRLSFARVLFHRPALVFLDEATSSLGEAAEKDIYRMLKDVGISYISTGHRSTLIPLHDMILQIDSSTAFYLYKSEGE